MILAGDVGGTNTRLALFDGEDPTPKHLETYRSGDHAGLDEIVRAFLAGNDDTITCASFGVAGPVRDGRTETVNLAWPVDAAGIALALGLERVGLLNDVEANAWGLASLGSEDVAVLQEGEAGATGNRAVISAGTGLGQAGLFWDGRRHHVFATEGGHVDFAPRGDLQVELYRSLEAEEGHVSYERLCSGMGIVNVYRFLRNRAGQPEPGWLLEGRSRGDEAGAIARFAGQGDATADAAMDTVLSIYGAQAGNLALTVMATGGVYVGGGIAPKNLTRFRSGGFVAAFVDKGRFRELMERIPIRVVLNDLTALFGAARHASEM